MIKFAQVLDVNEDDLTLDFSQKSSCKDCKSRCSDGFLDFLFNKKSQTQLKVGLSSAAAHKYHCTNQDEFEPARLQKGETLGVKFDDRQMLQMSFNMYGLPIALSVMFLLLFSLLAGMWGLNQDLMGVLGLVFGLFMSTRLIKRFNAHQFIKVQFFK